MREFEKVLSEHMQMMREREKQLEKEGIRVFKLSTTERQEFKECRQKWNFASYSRHGIEKALPSPALWFGTSIHDALEHLYNGEFDSAEKLVAHWKNWVQEYLASQTEEDSLVQQSKIDELLDLGPVMLEGYFTWSQFADHKEDTGFKNVLATEQEFMVPVKDDDGNIFRFEDGAGVLWEAWLVGRWDMLVEDFNGDYWILDHKTSRDKVNAEKLIWDDQMTVYLWAAREIYHKPFKGCYYNVLRKKVPTVPQVLKSGKMSVAKMIDTTYDVYLQALVDNGLNPDEYEEMLSYLLAKPNTFFERLRVERQPYELDMAGKFLCREALDMLNAPNIYPNFTQDCSWKCDYIPLCLGICKGDDVQYLLESQYRKRKLEEDSVYFRKDDSSDDASN